MEFPPQQLESADRLLATLGEPTVGGRIRRLRLNQNLSIRDLAERAGLNKNSLVRLEQGQGSRASTLLRVCQVLSVHLESLERAGDSDRPAHALHRAAPEEWHDMLDVSRGPLPDASVPGTLPIQLLASRLPGGRVMSTIILVTQESNVSSHRGEEFVLVLEGRLELQLGEEAIALNAGDSICFWSEETHRYRPSAAGGSARVLSVRVDY